MGRQRATYDAKKLLRGRVNAMRQLKRTCKMRGLRYEGLMDELRTLSKEPRKSYPEKDARRLGHVANTLGLDGCEIAKWFLSIKDLKNTAVVNRVRAAIKAHGAYHALREEWSSQEEVEVTLGLGGFSSTRHLRVGESMTMRCDDYEVTATCHRHERQGVSNHNGD